MGIFQGRSRFSRQLARTRRRGDRARDRLEQQRRKERRNLASRERDRARARTAQGSTPGWTQLRNIALFAVSLGMGALLAGPLHQQLGGWITLESGRLESLAIQGNDRLSHEEIADATGVAPGSPLTDIDNEAVEMRLTSHPWIRAAQILRLPPSTLLVRVEERRPAARLAGGGRHTVAGVERLVDPDGTPFAQATDPAIGHEGNSLPRLIGGPSLASGRPHAVLAEAIALLDRLRAGSPAWQMLGGAVELYLPQPQNSEGWVLRTHDQTLEIVLGHEAQLERFDRLEALLRAELPELAQPVRIDLRFADQAVLRRMSASS
jgi:cell division septal protein FtsQ